MDGSEGEEKKKKSEREEEERETIRGAFLGSMEDSPWRARLPREF